VVNELKDKAPEVMAMGAAGSAPAQAPAAEPDDVIEPVAAPAPAPAAPKGQAQAEALSALGNLGYAPGEAAGAVAQAAGDAPEASTSELIRAALKLLVPKG
jgi:Holliday junction DNA helicase RuvA